jgi:hypothetical protein
VTLAVPNSAIEIHDSTLDRVVIGNENTILHFSSVFIHQSAGRPLADAGSVWLQTAQIQIRDAVIKGSFSALPRNLLDGHIKLGALVLSNEIPIPLNYVGDVELRLESWGEVFFITGKSAELELFGEPKYVEEFQPDPPV